MQQFLVQHTNMVTEISLIFHFHFFPLSLSLPPSIFGCVCCSPSYVTERCSLIHKSWRLVIPSLICFSLIFILCAIYATYLNTCLNSFCNELAAPFKNNELPCNLLINRFLLNNETLLMASSNFYLVKYVAYARTILWLVVVLVMLLRCILHADFNVKELEELNGSAANDGDADNVSSVKFIVRTNSRDKVYKPTTQLQIDG